MHLLLYCLTLSLLVPCLNRAVLDLRRQMTAAHVHLYRSRSVSAVHLLSMNGSTNPLSGRTTGRCPVWRTASAGLRMPRLLWKNDSLPLLSLMSVSVLALAVGLLGRSLRLPNALPSALSMIASHFLHLQ